MRAVEKSGRSGLHQRRARSDHFALGLTKQLHDGIAGLALFWTGIRVLQGLRLRVKDLSLPLQQ